MGAEYDENLITAVFDTLREMKAKSVASFSGMAGSQDVRVETYVIGDDTIVVEIETYAGLSIETTNDLAQIIAERVGRRSAKPT